MMNILSYLEDVKELEIYENLGLEFIETITIYSRI